MVNLPYHDEAGELSISEKFFMLLYFSAAFVFSLTVYALCVGSFTILTAFSTFFLIAA